MSGLKIQFLSVECAPTEMMLLMIMMAMIMITVKGVLNCTHHIITVITVNCFVSHNDRYIT